MRAAALIVAAGIGSRAGAGLPKQYRPLAGVAVLRRTVEAMLASPRISAVQVVIGPLDRAHYDTAMAGLSDPRLRAPALGGDSRRNSVLNGLTALANEPPDLVLIHDAARPLLPLEVIDRVLDALTTHQATLPALPATDALWRAKNGRATVPKPRTDIWLAQTPQGFHFAAILKAHHGFVGTADDDIAIARSAGIAAQIVSGDERNFKLTEAGDFARAERMLEETLDIRTANGFDVHRFGPGDHVMLCGVRIKHRQGLVGHSDADVAMHALTDALFGALAEGDIGQWFPPSEAKWKGAASSIFLAKAMERVAARGFKVTNLDCTIICEAPKISPHALAMRAEIARLTGIAEDRISVKATTTEELGFTGRGEGIAALASATLVSK